MIWKTEPNLEGLNNISKGTLVEHLGIKMIDFGDDYLKASMPVDHRTKQPMGLLHGGASVALAETLGSIASTLCVENIMNSSVVGLEINANHLKSATEGQVIGTVKPIRIGRKIHVWSIEIKNEKNQITCVSRLTVMIIDKT